MGRIIVKAARVATLRLVLLAAWPGDAVMVGVDLVAVQRRPLASAWSPATPNSGVPLADDLVLELGTAPITLTSEVSACQRRRGFTQGEYLPRTAAAPAGPTARRADLAAGGDTRSAYLTTRDSALRPS